MWVESGHNPCAESIDAAIKTGATHISDDWQALVRHPAIDVIVECTGHPIAAVDHCLEAFAHGKHVVNVTVEADAFCGPLLARKAAQAGGVFARVRRPAGAHLRPGGLGAHLRLPGGGGRPWPQVAAAFQRVDPDTVWGHYGLTPEQAVRGGLNPKMFNSFLDGSKPSIESTAVSNATHRLACRPTACSTRPPAWKTSHVTRPISEGGVLERKGMVEVISSLEADGRKIPYDIRMGVGHGGGRDGVHQELLPRNTTRTPTRAGATSRCTSAGT